MPSSSLVAISRIPIATEFKGCSRVKSVVKFRTKMHWPKTLFAEKIIVTVLSAMRDFRWSVLHSHVPQSLLSDQVTCVESSAMCALSIEIDRVLSFLTIRRHLLFFYSYPQGYPTEPIETMLRRHGNDMLYELEMFVDDCYERGNNFPAVVHPYFIRGPTVFVPMAYDAPAFPHVPSSEQSAIGFMLILGSFCKSHDYGMIRWNGPTS